MYKVQEFTFKVQISNKWLGVSDASRSNEKPAALLTSNSQSELGNVREFLMLSQKCIWCLVINVAYTQISYYYLKELWIVLFNGIFYSSYLKAGGKNSCFIEYIFILLTSPSPKSNPKWNPRTWAKILWAWRFWCKYMIQLEAPSIPEC